MNDTARLRTGSIAAALDGWFNGTEPNQERPIRRFPLDNEARLARESVPAKGLPFEVAP